MKIGITCYPTYGGSGVVATELGKKLTKYGHEVHFITYALPYRLTDFTPHILYHEVEVLHYPLFEYPPYSLSLASKMVEVIEYQKLDLLHVHYAIPHATSAYLAKQMLIDKNFKVVTTLHGTDITLLGSDPSYYKITKFSIEQSSGVTAVSEFLKAETQRVLKVSNHIEVIPNFIPFSVTPIHNIEEIRARFAGKDEYIITHISNFRPLKRITDIVPIVKAVIKKHKVKVLMVGDGPERFKAEEQCRQENICDHVHFLGKQENVQDILAISDIMLLPSESESFGLAALEAMALGIPCVTSNAGGLTEVNINKLTGFTIDVGDIQGYAEAINTILDDRKMARKMGKNAIELSDSKYSPNIIIPKYLQYYEEILSA